MLDFRPKTSKMTLKVSVPAKHLQSYVISNSVRFNLDREFFSHQINFFDSRIIALVKDNLMLCTKEIIINLLFNLK